MERFFFMFFYCFILNKVTTAQVIRTRTSGPLLPGEIPGARSTLQPPQSLYRTPKCYPETATAYFLPAPPSAPKVTVLDLDWVDKFNFNINSPEIYSSLSVPPNIITNRENIQQSYNPTSVLSPSYKYNFPETTASLPPSIIFNRATKEPPCNPSSVLPDLVDNMPLHLQNRFVRLVDSSSDKGCDTCSKLIETLPIFNFDKELLDGFLAGLGINM